MEPNKRKIINLFHEHVKGRVPDVSGRNIRHDGRRGHWLEAQFGVSANADNKADLYGYELKNETISGKTTFGDWSANEYIFKIGPYVDFFDGSSFSAKQDSFCRMFGKSNPLKNGRYSWSGSPIPKIGNYNSFGQIMIIEPNKDIVIYYSYEEDHRLDKNLIIPAQLTHGPVELARWYGEFWPLGVSKNLRDKTLKEKLEDKFNNLGWFTCKTDASGAYNSICFGDPVTFDNWILLVANGTVYFDSGMYEGNGRPYSQWRANNDYWNNLIIDCYE